MNILELYERGYTKFKFSDGVSREVDNVDYRRTNDKLRFRTGLPGPRIWYYDSTGEPNIPGGYPHVTGVEGLNMREQGERTKRDEIRKAIGLGVSASCCVSDDNYDDVVLSVMDELDKLVERWTDEETGEDLDKSIAIEDVYEGMRIKIVKDGDHERPRGATGTVVKDDKDQSPGVRFDPPYTRCNLCESPTHGEYIYVNVDQMEKLEENEQDTEVST